MHDGSIQHFSSKLYIISHRGINLCYTYTVSLRYVAILFIISLFYNKVLVLQLIILILACIVIIKWLRIDQHLLDGSYARLSRTHKLAIGKGTAKCIASYGYNSLETL